VEPRTLAAYPFLKESAEFVRTKGPSLDELLKDMAYEEVRTAGIERVRSAFEKGDIQNPSCRTDRDCLSELLAYLCARLVVSVAGNPQLIRRYALSEAKRAGRQLETEPIDTVLSIAEELGLPAAARGDGATLHFTHYMRYSAQLRAAEWKLINRRVDRGQVELTKAELCRVIEEFVKRRMEAELPLGVPSDVMTVFAEPARELRDAADARMRNLEPKEMGEIRVECFPPCMKQMLAMAQAGENVPHSGRFALVAFLHTLGSSSEEIMKLFSASPDFQEDKTRYQVEHITGLSSGTKYTPPGCDTMKTYSLCYKPDHICKKEWLTHPLKYYKLKLKPMKGKGPESTGEKGEKQTADAKDAGAKNEEKPLDGTDAAKGGGEKKGKPPEGPSK
jgi:DNA primase large subunit